MRHYFITGATGSVGSAFLRRVLKQQESVTLIVRADTEDLARDRTKRMLLNSGMPANAIRQIRLVRGDLCRPEMGLDTDDYHHLSTSCTHIIHCAGNVHMNLPLPEARRQTLTMTNSVLELMARSRTAEKMEFVSTVGVAGRTTGELAETWLNSPRQFRNSYEAAKAEAEEKVRERSAARLPITVHRPSMVVGDSRTGRTIAFQVFYYLCEFLSGARSFGVLPNFNGMQLDIIPSDYVAALLEASSQNTGSPIPILHSCSGETGAVELTTLLDRVRSLFIRNGRDLPPIRFVSIPLFKLATTIIKPLLPPKQRKALGSLPYFLSYLEERQYFGNRVTKQFAQSKGIQLPEVDEYLGTVLQFYLSKHPKSQAL